eukprot:c19699_g1_i2.p1 GENE.c19699_g1_i2~~c19699_g1_i2.p1  ORF type:complete len:376 (-),score=41.41 c19699_g1_i2:1-1047(-)
MNLPEQVSYAVYSDPYFKSLLTKKTYHEVIFAIDEEVMFVEPFIPNTGGMPSKALCLLFKFSTLKLTPKQLHGLLRYENPFVRALGFAYVRFCVQPDQQWNYYKDYMQDKQKFIPTGHPVRTKITIAEWIYDLMTKTKWFSIIMPRLPSKHRDDFAHIVDDARAELQANMSDPEDDVPSAPSQPTADSSSSSSKPPSQQSRGTSKDDSDRGSQRSKSDDRSRDGGRDRDRDRDDYRRRDSSPRRSRDRDRDRDRERERDRDRRGHRDDSRERPSRKRSRSPVNRNRSPVKRDTSPPRRTRSPSPRRSPSPVAEPPKTKPKPDLSRMEMQRQLFLRYGDASSGAAAPKY